VRIPLQRISDVYAINYYENKRGMKNRKERVWKRHGFQNGAHSCLGVHVSNCFVFYHLQTTHVCILKTVSLLPFMSSIPLSSEALFRYWRIFEQRG
jgi:hypothetical protein